MNRNWIFLILSLPLLFCTLVFLWAENPLLILVPLGIAALIFVAVVIAFIFSAELTTFDAWDLLIRSILYRLGFNVQPPKSLDHDEDDEHEHHHETRTESPMSLDDALQKVIALTGATTAYIVRRDSQSDEFEIKAQHGNDSEKLGQIESAVAQEVINSQAAIQTSNAQQDSRYSSQQNIVGMSLKSIMAVPVSKEDKVIGVIYVEMPIRNGIFKQDDVEAVTNIAQELADSLEAVAPDTPILSEKAITKTEEAKPAPPIIDRVDYPSLALEEIADEEDDAFGETEEEASEVVINSPVVPSPKPITSLPGSSGGELPPEEAQEANELGSSKRDEESSKEEQSEAPIAQETQFTAYYPRQVNAKQDYMFMLYAHLPNALIQGDVEQFKAQLGGRIPKAVMANEAVTLQEGALLTVMIHCDKLKFNQVGAMQQWQAPFTRFDFHFSAEEALVDEIIEGRAAILLGMIEIASIDFQMSVGAPLPVKDGENSAIVGLKPSQSVPPYQKIFVSYSRKDSIVAEHYRAAQTMLGNSVFMDIHSIRAGEDWEVALKRFISEADVFQLFWSEHSATSEHVRFEWDYALKQRCPETLCKQFIRPSYWQKPMPSVPSELSHLHFAYVEIN